MKILAPYVHFAGQKISKSPHKSKKKAFSTNAKNKRKSLQFIPKVATFVLNQGTN